jgi:hypothetical protein
MALDGRSPWKVTLGLLGWSGGRVWRSFFLKLWRSFLKLLSPAQASMMGRGTEASSLY